MHRSREASKHEVLSFDNKNNTEPSFFFFFKLAVEGHADKSMSAPQRVVRKKASCYCTVLYCTTVL